jgi:hypothetical protein
MIDPAAGGEMFFASSQDFRTQLLYGNFRLSSSSLTLYHAFNENIEAPAGDASGICGSYAFYIGVMFYLLGVLGNFFGLLTPLNDILDVSQDICGRSVHIISQLYFGATK